MPTVRVLTQPDGSALVIHPAPKAQRPGEPPDAFAQRVFAETLAKHPEWQALPFVDMDRTLLPATRAKRYAWHLNPAQTAIVVDPTIPAPPNSQEARDTLRAELAAATTVAAMKAALLKLLP